MGGVEICYFRIYYVLFKVQIDGMKLTTSLNTVGHKDSVRKLSLFSFSYANRFAFSVFRVKTSSNFFN